jgi:DNA-binding protein H-NS
VLYWPRPFSSVLRNVPSLQELLAQKAALERQIAEQQRQERADAIARVRALMDEYGLSAADIVGRASAPARKGDAKKVPPKYRDPATGQTWSGRGLQPNWLKAALEQGRKLDDFAL